MEKQSVSAPKTVVREKKRSLSQKIVLIILIVVCAVAVIEGAMRVLRVVA